MLTATSAERRELNLEVRAAIEEGRSFPVLSRKRQGITVEGYQLARKTASRQAERHHRPADQRCVRRTARQNRRRFMEGWSIGLHHCWLVADE
jgi:hypothetical protein